MIRTAIAAVVVVIAMTSAAPAHAGTFSYLGTCETTHGGMFSWIICAWGGMSYGGPGA